MRFKKLPPWEKDPTAENLIKKMTPKFGDMNHKRAGQCWAQLELLYKRETKGAKTRDTIAKLEEEIKNLLPA